MKDTALKVMEGVKQPANINEQLAITYKRKSELSLEQFVEGILSGNRSVLARAITIIESSLPKHEELAQQIIERCISYSGSSIRVGITGVPGVGKSSFIETLGKHIIESGSRLAVLAVDPTSQRSKGSILGDKTRMEDLSKDERVFIRPSPAGASLGGVAKKTRETILLCEAAGYDIVFIETVGVGQSETVVHSMVDFFLLLMLAGAGDELQGIKRGIMEMADLIAITKADGNNIDKANVAMAEYRAALHLFPATESGWIPKVLTCSALENTNISSVWNVISEYIQHTKQNQFYSKKRREQAIYWMHQFITDTLTENFYNQKNVKQRLSSIEQSVLSGRATSYQAAKELLNMYYEQ
jgi:LAO/AO transport system kinase